MSVMHWVNFRDKLNSEEKAEVEAAQLKVTLLQAITVSYTYCMCISWKKDCNPLFGQ